MVVVVAPPVGQLGSHATRKEVELPLGCSTRMHIGPLRNPSPGVERAYDAAAEDEGEVELPHATPRSSMSTWLPALS